MPASDHKRRLTAFVVAMAVLIATPLAVVATTEFTDVPTSSVHHDNIDWLKDTGVTVGCNPPANDQYCPGDNVSRAQMATFMRRLAENQVVDAATAIEANHAATADSATTAGDADTLDGFDSSDLAPRAAYAFSGGLPDTDTTLDTTIVAPVRGLVVVNATVDITRSSADDTVICEVMVDGSVLDGSSMFARVNTSLTENICSTTGAVEVDPGSHEVTFNIRSVTGASLFDGFLTAMWVPFDGTGITPASAGPQGSASDDKSSDE